MIENPIIIGMPIQEDVLRLRIENEQLKAQNEKMRCCENCSNFKHRIDHRCNTECKNLSKWELAE